MNSDKALKKALIRKTGGLPYGFEDRVMKQVMLEARKRGRRVYYQSLALVSAVSLAIIGGSFYALNAFFSFNILHLFSGIHLSGEARSLFGFCFYIALLVLILLGLDFKFRQMVEKKRNNSAN
jgi:hypothetical protein